MPVTTLATPDDLPDILQMIEDLSAFHGNVATITPDQLRDAVFGPTPNIEVFIAKVNGAAVGYAGLTRSIVLHNNDLRVDIQHLFVAKSHRRTGIGSALIGAARDHARMLGATRLTIGSDPDNATSIAAYRAMSNLTEITGTGPRFCIDLAP